MTDIFNCQLPLTFLFMWAARSAGESNWMSIAHLAFICC